MDRTLVEAAKETYKLDYPGFIRGQCIDKGKSVSSFLVFDSDPYAYSWLRVHGSEGAIGVPFSTASMFARPTPTLAPTPTPGVSQEVEIYMRKTIIYLSLVPNAIIGIRAALAQPEIDSNTWRSDIAVHLGVVRASYSLLLELHPPEMWAGVHATLVNAMRQCNEATYRIETVIINRDPAPIQEAYQLIQQCHIGFEAVQQQIKDVLRASGN